VLRIGTSSVCGVGVVVGDTEWNDRFGDVDGWDLQHVRRVKWLWKQNTDFSTYALKWGDTVQRLTSEPVLDWIRTLEIPDSEMAREIADFPRSAGVRRDTSETIAEYLFDHGIASQSIRDLTNEIAELSRIAKWYQSSCNPSEPETVAYLVIPLLRALGWTPQKMAIEWRKVDIALFRSLPRDTGKRAFVSYREVSGPGIRREIRIRAVSPSDCDRWPSLCRVFSDGAGVRGTASSLSQPCRHALGVSGVRMRRGKRGVPADVQRLDSTYVRR